MTSYFSMFLLLAALSVVNAQLPNHPPIYQMNSSTIIMPCDESNFTDPASTKGCALSFSWPPGHLAFHPNSSPVFSLPPPQHPFAGGIVDFDWSNAKEIWAKNKPMNDEELLFEQVKITTAATPGATVWVYRCSVYGSFIREVCDFLIYFLTCTPHPTTRPAYPWYTSVRTLLDNPAYEPWFIKFKPKGPWFSPKCDNNYNPAKCSDYYHMQEQTPGYPHGDGTCAAPACDCGTVPCGFYLWNHSSTAVVNGQTFQEWFINSYMFNEVGSSPLVSGFFWDDFWPGQGGNFPDASSGRIVSDTGMTQDDLTHITDAYNENMEALKKETLSRGKFSWQMLWTGGKADAKGGTAPGPLVTAANCAPNLRALCSADSPQHNNRTMMYAFSNRDPSLANHSLFMADLSNFLLTRGDYAYVGHGVSGCAYLFHPNMPLSTRSPSLSLPSSSSLHTYTVVGMLKTLRLSR